MTIGEAFRRAMLGLAIAVAGAFVAVLLFVGYCAYTLPLSRAPSAQTAGGAVIYATTAGEPFAARGVYRGDKITAEQLPQPLADAIVAIEDRRFYRHGGIDPHGIARAAWRNLTGSGGTEGASTITQQLARLSYLSPERNLRRKVQEAMIAVWLESRLSKQEILARYLNEAYFGAGAYGADAAARRYFGKKAGDLDVAQAAMLAGLVRAPSQLAPNRNPEAAQRRAALVIQAMLDTGKITAEQAAAARSHPVRLAVPPEPEPGQNYFIDAGEAELRRLIGSPPIDLTVTTTLDPRLQQAAENIVGKWLDKEGAKRGIGQAALIAMAPDGAILAMVGGRDYRVSQFNRALQARRQPGSLFKVIVYLTALTNGFTPQSTVVDRPVQIGDWEPQNYEGGYRGAMPLRTAFAQSINTVAAQLVQTVGVNKVIEMAKSLGVQSELPAVPSLALGSAEVTLLEMTRVLGAIAIDSKSVEPFTIRSIAGPNNATLYARPETVRDPPNWNRAAMVQLLEAVVNEGTGRAARLDHRAGGKTGTTQDYRDAWFVGFTTDFTVGVWVGNDDNSPMEKVTGGDVPAKIWHDFMVEAQRLKPAAAAPVPAKPEEPPSQLAKETPPEPPGQGTTAAPAAPVLRGKPQIVDTGTLVVDGTTIRLNGVVGETGEYVDNLNYFIHERDLTCVPVPEAGADQYRCFVGRQDLAEAIVRGGAGRAAPDAYPILQAAQRRAQSFHRGVWRR